MISAHTALKTLLAAKKDGLHPFGRRGPFPHALQVTVLLALLCNASLAAQGVADTSGQPGPAGADGGASGSVSAQDQVGYASWYGSRFHGRLTASGAVYDMDKMTAAHKTLPFGTKVRVTNLENGKSVEVTINDRGPFVAGRIIDLSRAAAEAIGLTGQGVAKVRLHVITLGNGQRVAAKHAETSPASSIAQPSSVILQLGAFRNLDNAVRLTKLLDRSGFSPIYERSGNITRVVLLSVPRQDIGSIRRRLSEIGVTSVLVREE